MKAASHAHFMITSPLAVKRVYMIGAGGVASWLLPLVIKLFGNQKEPADITVFDGDKLEKHNLDRQLFRADQVGQFKADALIALYGGSYSGNLVARNEYFVAGMERLERNAVYLVCVDNHAARKAVLETVDSLGGRVIIGANEYTDAEAYIYEPDWQGSKLDPRIYYKEITTDDRDDPTRPESCQGSAAIRTPQLVLANFSAANFMAWLLWFHYVERSRMDKSETFDYWPYLHRNNFSRFSTCLLGQALKPPTVAPAAKRKEKPAELATT